MRGKRGKRIKGGFRPEVWLYSLSALYSQVDKALVGARGKAVPEAMEGLMNCAKCGREIEGPVDRAVITIARGRLTLHAWCLWRLLGPRARRGIVKPQQRLYLVRRTNGAAAAPARSASVENQPE